MQLKSTLLLVGSGIRFVNSCTKYNHKMIRQFSPMISNEQIASYRTSFKEDYTAKIAQNAIANNALNDVALNRELIQKLERNAFSTQLDSWPVTNQKSSGRCWLFATLNLFRPATMKKLNVKEFEFSQAFIHFWDKFERSNHLLEAIIETSERDADDRTVSFLLGDPIGDGGQWNMAMNLIRKHGLVPKSIFPESFSSSSTAAMNTILKETLRSAACEIRSIIHSYKDDTVSGIAAARIHKEKRMSDIWRILCIHLGTPPESFEYQYKDKDNKYKRIENMTPLGFMNAYVSTEWEDYVCLVHDPRHATMQTYTVEYLQNVVGGPPVIYLNVDIDDLKAIAVKSLVKDGVPVWMGCDVGKQLDRKAGTWDINMFEYNKLYNVEYSTLNKADRLRYRQTMMTHAMLFTGVDMDTLSVDSSSSSSNNATSPTQTAAPSAEAIATSGVSTSGPGAVDVTNGGTSCCDIPGKPRRWRVENSWGDSNGVKGYYTMSDNWFNEHMFEIAAPRCNLTPAMLHALEAATTTAPTVVLPAWDPMGSLATQEAGDRNC